jgi:hypothetical protein
MLGITIRDGICLDDGLDTTLLAETFYLSLLEG